MEVMTVTDTLGHRPDGWWTIDDLSQLPDDGMRYELVDGSLLVSPSPTPRHGEVLFLLRRLLDRQAPPDMAVSNDVGVQIGSVHTYFIPDLFVIPRSGFRAHPRYLLPGDVRLAVEVLSEHNRGRDLVLKRHYYGTVGIPRYWVVDPFEHTLTVLALSGTAYEQEAVVAAGTTWGTDDPFPLKVDPADFC
jgi:Uma2 family endonuclease